ncbi:MAG: TraB family protein, partial [Nanoarchaeota archaeon]
MQRVKNLILIGTSHIAQQSVDDVKNAIQEYKPKIIAIELDQKRMHALLHPEKHVIRITDIRKIGLKGFLFNILGAWLQKKLGK